MDGFEQRLRHGLQGAASGVEPTDGLGSRVRGARRAQVRRRRAGRAGAGAVLAVALVLGVVSLPGGSGPTDGGVGVAAAAELTTATSFRFETVVRMGEGTDELRAEGEVAAGAESARIVTTSPLPFGDAASGTPFEVRLDEERLYVSIGSMLGPEVLPEGAEWLVVDLSGRGYAGRIFGSMLDQVGDVDPTRALDLLGEVSEGVVEDGEEEVRGEPTTRYRFETRIDPDRAADEGFDAPGRAWVDGEGRLRRLEVSQAGTTATIELFDFGAEVDVEAPPAADTVTIDRFMREGLGGMFGETPGG